MRERLAPFLVLLEARYAPLLFAASPQAYAVYRWLWMGSDTSAEAFVFAVLGAIGFEFVYVGAIAWAEDGSAGRWTWVTAGIALVFSVAVAIYVYREQGWWSVLHAGFPLVCFGYTMQLHGMLATKAKPAPKHNDATPVNLNGDTLPTIVKWKEQDGLTFQEIGDRLGVSRQAAQQKYKIARQP